MSNPFSKGWKYLMSSFDQAIDENADPKVQINQAIEAAKKQHQQINEHAASIIGNNKQISVQLDRLLKSQEQYQNQARQAIQLADKAAQEGDATKAAEYNGAAEVIASQLVAVEQEIEQTKTLYQQSEQAAKEAQSQVQQSEARLKEQLAEAQRMLTQLDQTAMQEKTSATMASLDASLEPNGNTPTLDSVREKIERRYANALGRQELLGNTVNDRMVEIASSARDLAASAKLAEIRASMNSEAAEKPALEAGKSETPEENPFKNPAN